MRSFCLLKGSSVSFAWGEATHHPARTVAVLGGDFALAWSFQKGPSHMTCMTYIVSVCVCVCGGRALASSATTTGSYIHPSTCSHELIESLIVPSTGRSRMLSPKIPSEAFTSSHTEKPSHAPHHLQLTSRTMLPNVTLPAPEECDSPLFVPSHLPSLSSRARESEEYVSLGTFKCLHEPNQAPVSPKLLHGTSPDWTKTCSLTFFLCRIFPPIDSHLATTQHSCKTRIFIRQISKTFFLIPRAYSPPMLVSSHGACLASLASQAIFSKPATKR